MNPSLYAPWILLTTLLASACSPEEASAQPRPGQLRPGHYPANTSQEPSPDFIRFIDGGTNTGKLQTAIVTYEGEAGERVELIAAVHIADRGYFQRLEKLFGTYDSLLYELIQAKGATHAAPRRSERSEASGMLGYFQRYLRDTLELEFQLDAVDYRADNFVHADLDAETFFAISEERGESLPQMMLRAAFSAAGNEEIQTDPALGFKMLFAFFAPNRAQLLKYLLAKQLQQMEALLAGLEKGEDGADSVILVERNKACMKVLHQRLERGEKQIGVFYGGAHMPDIERRIFAEIGLRRTGTRWEDAWVIEKP